MRKFLFRLTLVILLLGAFAGQALAGGFCAIAYSRSTGRWGDSYRCDSRRQAEWIALQKCPVSDRFVAMWGYNTWISLAAGSGGAWGTGRSVRRHSSERQALRNCPAADRHIVISAYSFN